MAEKIEVFYTGGGITLAEAVMDNNRYAVVNSEAPDFLTIYKQEDGENTYLPEDMILSAPEGELAPEHKALYMKMLEKLKTA